MVSTVSMIKIGDVTTPLVDGRERRLGRVSRPNRPQADELAHIGIHLPEWVGTDEIHKPVCSPIPTSIDHMIPGT
jgi:hypothetical protein